MGFWNRLWAKPSDQRAPKVLAPVDPRKQEFDEFTQQLLARGTLEPIEVNLALRQSEFGYLEGPVALYENRAVRAYQSGPRLYTRIMPGVSISTGSSGHSKSHDEMTFVADGVLTLTNQRLVFIGVGESRTIPLDKVISIQSAPNGMIVSVESRTKNMWFDGLNPYIWPAVYQLVTGTGELGTLVKKVN
jgi:hypothetical protein